MMSCSNPSSESRDRCSVNSKTVSSTSGVPGQSGLQSETFLNKTKQTNKQNPQTGIVIKAGMLQGFQKKARVRHAAVSGQMRVWQMGTIIHRPAIRGAIVGHRHMDTRSAGPVRFLFFGLHGKPRACTILGGSTESSVTGQQGLSVLSLLNISYHT